MVHEPATGLLRSVRQEPCRDRGAVARRALPRAVARPQGRPPDAARVLSPRRRDPGARRALFRRRPTCAARATTARSSMRKKALQAFTGMLRELKSGGSVIVTADVPKISRVAGLGIVTLAKYSQCPILPLAMATSRVHPPVELGPHLLQPAVRPHGLGARRARSACARDADDAALEAARVAGRKRAQCRDRARLCAGAEPAQSDRSRLPLRRPCGTRRIVAPTIELISLRPGALDLHSH